jgi:acetyl-CoA acyltransferase 1
LLFVLGRKSPDDVVIVAALRTPLQRARKGAFATVCQEELLSIVLKGVLQKTGINPALVDDVLVGNVLPPVNTLAFFEVNFEGWWGYFG